MLLDTGSAYLQTIGHDHDHDALCTTERKANNMSDLYLLPYRFVRHRVRQDSVNSANSANRPKLTGDFTRYFHSIGCLGCPCCPIFCGTDGQTPIYWIGSRSEQTVVAAGAVEENRA